MKLNSTTITKGVIYLMGFAVIAVCAILLPELAREEAVGKVNPPTSWPFLLGAWVMSVPIFVALYQSHKLLSYIDNNKTFSSQSVKSLRNIKYCSVIFAILVVLGVMTVVITARIVDPYEDVTPVFTFGFIFTFVSSVIATFTAVLQRLLQEAINIKSENDLTI